MTPYEEEKMRFAATQEAKWPAFHRVAGVAVATVALAEIDRLRAENVLLQAEREALYQLCWKWGFDQEEGTYHPDNPPARYGEWVVPHIRIAAGIDPPDGTQ